MTEEELKRYARYLMDSCPEINETDALDIVYWELEGKPRDLPPKEAKKALIRSGLYPGNRCWTEVTADLIREGLCKEEILKRLAAPYIEAGTTEAFAYRRALESYETIAKIMRHK
ncbi:MAG: hypothetical protein HY893_02725 [Deltaproteobacteria bacterium]|nr:hypothetical protein [Deltaproteobacteria bacterium]